MVITQLVLNVFKRKISFKELSFTRCLTSSTDFICCFQPHDGLWYRPKYRIIGVENKSSRIKFELGISSSIYS